MNMPEIKDDAYKKAGVDIEAGDQLVKKIAPKAAATKRPGVMDGLGGFGALFDLKAAGFKDPVLVSSTDGVGTKLRIALDTNRYDTIGIDLVAMCVNDLVVSGATPLFFLDYFACGRLNVPQAATIIEGIAQGCAESGCALIGGETAEMPGLYQNDDFDLAGFAVGAFERGQGLSKESVREGDVALALSSSGLHSNGFSLVRKIVKDAALSYDTPAPFESSAATLGDALLVPTRLYAKPLLEALKIQDQDHRPALHGLAHITGGGLLENLPRILPDHLGIMLDASKWALPPVIGWLKKAAELDEKDMLRTFNCGVGMVAVCAPSHAEDVADTLRKAGIETSIAGQIRTRKKETPTVTIENADTLWED